MGNQQVSGLASLTDVHMKVQKLRVATGNRVKHLEKHGKVDGRTEAVHEQLNSLESRIERFLAEEFQEHPVYPWTSKIKGCGMEAAAKVVGIIENTHFKSTGRGGIEAFDTMSRLRRYAGLAPTVDGTTEKRVKGQKGLHYNPELRVMLWRLLTRLMQQGGVWYKEYAKNDSYYTQRFERDGYKIVPTPKGRFCPLCQEEKEVSKTMKNCPDCGEKLSGKMEPPMVIFRGHVVAMAKRKTIRLWLDCLWLIWREALGLPTRGPYIVEYGGHHLIEPWSMTDR